MYLFFACFGMTCEIFFVAFMNYAENNNAILAGKTINLWICYHVFARHMYGCFLFMP